MPLDRYSCEKCSASFEQMRSRAAVATAVTCPKCGSESVALAFGLPAKPLPESTNATNCRGDGPPCGAAMCGRVRTG